MTKRSGVMLQADLIALAGLWDDIHEWQTETFGDGGAVYLSGPATHLVDEAEEVLDAAGAIETYESSDYRGAQLLTSSARLALAEELADVFFMLVQCVERADVNLATAVAAKLEKNKKRRWQEPDENGVVNHAEEDT